jgi:AcrR family transcriptional regulator
MNAGKTARERARAELTREIKNEARRQLASSSADALSLRAVARELGMVSSALYRYFPSRDDLLTALIIDAYDALGEAAEKAEADVDRSDPRGRWLAGCHAVRTWARDHPHEYALIYGSPVPGYQAPQNTVAAAARVALLLTGVLRDAFTAGRLTVPDDSRPLTPVLAEQVTGLAAQIAPELPPAVLVNALIAWTQLFGMVSFELFGQLVGSVDPSDEFFAAAAERMADLVGLPA